MITTDGQTVTTPSQQLLQVEPNIRIPLINNNNNVVTDLINTNLSSRLIPKIGSIVKRFSLSYSGEGLVTDRQRVRTVRVGIRFQVQVDSFSNRDSNNQRPRGITRTNSAPIDFVPKNYNSPSAICDTESCENLGLNSGGTNQRQLALEYSPKTSPTVLKKTFVSSGNVNTATALGEHLHPSQFKNNYQSDIDLDSSSGVSSLAGSNSQSPVLCRRHSSSLAFHNRINQALNLCRNQLAAVAASRETDYASRRASVQVLRRDSISPVGSPPKRDSIMEDSSSYQVLRYFPGSNINSAREFSWETAAFEKDVKDKVQWLGEKFSRMRIPPFVSRLLGMGKDYALENPITAVLFLAVGIACALPISIFLGFAVATVLFTFLGFLLVEGTLLTVATVVLGGVVLLFGLLTLACLTTGFLSYSTISQIYSFFTGGSNIKDLFHKIPILGYFLSSSAEPDAVQVQKYENTSSQPKPLLKNGFVHKIPNGHGPPLAKVEDYDEDEVESEVDSEEELSEEEKDQDEEEDQIVIQKSQDAEEESKGIEVDNQEIIVEEQLVQNDLGQEDTCKPQETVNKEQALAQTD